MKCAICKAPSYGELCLQCRDEKEYWDMVDRLAMEKQDGATLHLKPHRKQGRSRF